MKFCTWVWPFVPGYEILYLGMTFCTWVWNFAPVYIHKYEKGSYLYLWARYDISNLGTKLHTWVYDTSYLGAKVLINLPHDFKVFFINFVVFLPMTRLLNLGKYLWWQKLLFISGNCLHLPRACKGPLKLLTAPLHRKQSRVGSFYVVSESNGKKVCNFVKLK
jgi:hypothetical protein